MTGQYRAPQRVAFDAYGVRGLVETDDPALLDRVIEHLPYECVLVTPEGNEALFRFVTTGEASTPYRVEQAGDEIAAGDDLEDALDLLASHLQIHVAEMAEDRVFLHAGVVAWGKSAIVLPGRSYAGKTTLVRELVRAGAVYYSDEYAVLDDQGLVHPFTRPLSIRGDSWRQEPHPVETLGGTAGTGSLPVDLVVLSEYRRYARWRPERLSPGQGLLELLNHAVPARRKPAVVMDTLERVVACAPVVRVKRGEARRAVPRLLAMLEQRSP